MSKAIARVVVALVCGLMTLVGCVPAYAAEGGLLGGWVSLETGAPVDVSGTPACGDEGQEYGPCLWDAGASGNQSGESYLLEEDGSVTYLRRADGTAVGVGAKKKSKAKKSPESSEPVTPAPSEPPAARAYPGWVWTGRTAPVATPGLPACVDVRGQETCTRQGYVLVVDQAACTQRIVTDQGDEYVPGAAVAQALSDSCVAWGMSARAHSDEAGLSGVRGHSAAPSAAVRGVVAAVSAPSRGVEAVVGPTGPAASSARVDYDEPIGLVALVLMGGALGWWAWCRRPRRRVGRHGAARW